MSFFQGAGTVTINGGTFQMIGSSDTIEIWQKIWSKHIAPGASYDAAARGDVPACHPETRKVIIAKIMDWVKNPEGFACLWMYGPAGSGKTTIMQTIAKICDDEHLLAASFFFSRSAADRPQEKTHFISTIACQMSLSIPGMHQQVLMAIQEDPNIFSKVLSRQMESLIIKPLHNIQTQASSNNSHIHPQLIVVDGLDECRGDDSQAEVLKVLTAATQQLTIPFIFLVASRPEHVIQNTFSRNPLAPLTCKIPLDNNYQAAADIRKFLISKFEDIKEQHPIGASLSKSWPSNADLDYLVEKSSGQFIYTSAAMKWIADTHHLPTQQLQNIQKSFPTTTGVDIPFAQLDALYIHVLSMLKTHPGHMEKALHILGWMIFEDYDKINPYGFLGKKLNVADKLLSFHPGTCQTVLTNLNSLIDFQKKDQPLKFFHASFPDFLLDKSHSGEFFIDAQSAHTNLACKWMEYYSNPQNRSLPEARHQQRNAEGLSISHMVRAIFWHCGQASLTSRLQDALFNLDLQAFLIITGGEDYFWLICILNFIVWLEHQNWPDGNKNLHQHYLQQLQKILKKIWSKYPSTINPHLPIALTLVYEDDLYENRSWLQIFLHHTDEDFDDAFGMRGILNNFGGPLATINTDIAGLAGSLSCSSQTRFLLCHILNDSQLPMHDGYFVDKHLYTELAFWLVGALQGIKRSETMHMEDMLLVTSLALTLPRCLAQAFPDKELAILLRDKSLLQVNRKRVFESTWESRHKYIPDRLQEMSLASLKYFKKSNVAFSIHAHPSEYNPEEWYCGICGINDLDIDLPVNPVPQNPGFVLDCLAQMLEATGIHVWLIIFLGGGIISINPCLIKYSVILLI